MSAPSLSTCRGVKEYRYDLRSGNLLIVVDKNKLDYLQLMEAVRRIPKDSSL